jgi:acetolactate synthase-1/2/3 large subunit
VVRSLEELDVEVIFGIPGGAVLPVYDPLFDSQKLRHVLVRHEQGAGHAASGYAHATGRVGVMMALRDPGPPTWSPPGRRPDGLHPGRRDHRPGRPGLIGTDAFQEADISGITMPITKHNFLVRNGDEIPRVIAEAFHIAATGRPARCSSTSRRTSCRASARSAGRRRWTCPATSPTPSRTAADPEAAKLIAAARKPVLYVGGGVIRGEATDELLDLAELTGIPVVTTLMARGAFPDSHPQHLGMPGMHGTVAAVAALQRSDLLSRWAPASTTASPAADVVRPGRQGHPRRHRPGRDRQEPHADVPIVGDVKAVIVDLIAALRRTTPGNLNNWWEYLSGIRSTYPLSYGPQSDGSLSPGRHREAGRDRRPGRVYVAGVGQHQMWAAQFIKYEKPRTWLNSGGLGTMGYAVPAAMGAKVARPTEVWAIDGDGCFQMTNQELATCAIEDIPIKVAMINNGNLGMVRQWQTLFYDERYSQHRPGDPQPADPRLRQAGRGDGLRRNALRA